MSSNEKIILNATELLAQSDQMRTLKEEYDAIFTQITSTLNEMNGGWSENLSNNFIGKISVAQKGFAKIVEMLGCGENVAKETANSFEDINAVMARTLTNDYSQQAIYTDGMGMTYTYQEVQEAKERVESGNYTKTDLRISNAKENDFLTGNWTKQDLLLANGGGFVLEDPVEHDFSGIFDGLAQMEESVFGTNHLGGLSNILSGVEKLGNGITQGNVFENMFGRVEEMTQDFGAIISGDLDSPVISEDMAQLIDNLESVQGSFDEGMNLQSFIQSSLYTSGYLNQQGIESLFGTIEDNLNSGSIVSEFFGLGEVGEAVSGIQDGIENIFGMDLSEIGESLGEGINGLYQDVAEGLPIMVNTGQDLISGVGDVFEVAGSVLGNLF